jgi:hypothetical protein
MPRTLRSRPPLRCAATPEKLLLDAEPLGMEDRSDGLGNWRVSGIFGNLAMIMGVGENASWK